MKAKENKVGFTYKVKGLFDGFIEYYSRPKLSRTSIVKGLLTAELNGFITSLKENEKEPPEKV